MQRKLHQPLSWKSKQTKHKTIEAKACKNFFSILISMLKNIKFHFVHEDVCITAVYTKGKNTFLALRRRTIIPFSVINNIVKGKSAFPFIKSFKWTLGIYLPALVATATQVDNLQRNRLSRPAELSFVANLTKPLWWVYSYPIFFHLSITYLKEKVYSPSSILTIILINYLVE